MLRDLEECLSNKGIIRIVFYGPEITGFVTEHSLTGLIEGVDIDSIDIWYDHDYSFTIDLTKFVYDDCEGIWFGKTMSIELIY